MCQNHGEANEKTKHRHTTAATRPLHETQLIASHVEDELDPGDDEKESSTDESAGYKPDDEQEGDTERYAAAI